MTFSSIPRFIHSLNIPFIAEYGCLIDSDGLEICPQFVFVSRSRISGQKKRVQVFAEIMSDELDSKVSNEVSHVRKDFPESWIFDEVTVNDKNGLVIKKKIIFFLHLTSKQY